MDVLPFRRADALTAWLWNEFELDAQWVRRLGFAAYIVTMCWPTMTGWRVYVDIAGSVAFAMIPIIWWRGRFEKRRKALSVSRFNALQLSEREGYVRAWVIFSAMLYTVGIACMAAGFWPGGRPHHVVLSVMVMAMFYFAMTLSHVLTPEGPSKRRMRERLAKLVPDFSALPQGV